MKLPLLLIFVLYARNLKAQDDNADIICSARFCSDYMTTNTCRDIPQNCNIQNSTNNGLILPSNDPCNCCTYCLENLNENDYCADGDIGGSVPHAICGPGLSCTDEICLKMTTTDCTQAQEDYDARRQDGTLGALEISPNCDVDGFYEPYKCIPGETCFCVDKSGVRIFGEIAYTSSAHMVLKCQCSRKYHEALDFFDKELLYPNQYFRCAENGDYDTIQCIGNNCMCVDALDGAPTFPASAFVNITLISNKTLPDCFKNGIHEEGKYFHACAAKYLELLEEVEQHKAEGYDAVFETEFPSCSLDGRYGPVQTDLRTKTAYCADSDGNLIGNYRVSIDEFDVMNCNCARTTLILPESAPEKPDCLPNGNFNPVQYRRGMCYCVDENGYQNGNDSTCKQCDSF